MSRKRVAAVSHHALEVDELRACARVGDRVGGRPECRDPHPGGRQTARDRNRDRPAAEHYRRRLAVGSAHPCSWRRIAHRFVSS